MKSALRTMQEMLTVWLVCVLAGTSCAVFYTKSSDNDYPRIGRRAFFTRGDKGSSIPRIGRSSPLGFGKADNLSPFSSHTALHLLSPPPSKRGFFTSASQDSYPRVGRRAAASASVSSLLSGLLDSNPGGDSGSEELQSQSQSQSQSAEALRREEGGMSGETQYAVPLGMLFYQFDSDGDKQLSRVEFVQGMSAARRLGEDTRR